MSLFSRKKKKKNDDINNDDTQIRKSKKQKKKKSKATRKGSLSLFGGGGANNILGIDVGDSSIKLVTGSSDRRNINIDRFTSIQTPEGTVENGKILDMVRLGDAINRELEEKNIRFKKIAFSIDGTDIVSRIIQVPSVKEREIKKMLDFEIPEQLPVNMSENIIQMKEIDRIKTKEEKKTTVLVIAINRELIDGYVGLSNILGGEPYLLDTVYSSIDELLNKNVLINNESLKDRNTAFIDIGRNNIHINIYKKGNFAFNRIIGLGSADIDRNISKLFNINEEESKKRKELFGDINREYDPKTLEANFNTIFRSNVDRWISEIDRTIKFFIGQEFGNTIDHIFIYGGGTKITGLDSYIERNIEIKTSKLRDISNINNRSNDDDMSVDSYLNAIISLRKV